MDRIYVIVTFLFIAIFLDIKVAAQPEVLFVCDFETGVCGIKQDRTDSDYISNGVEHNWDWTRHKGAGQSQWTGPDVGHRGSQHYLLAHANEKDNEDYTRVIIPAHGVYEGYVRIRFAYHMYGMYMGTLVLEQGTAGYRHPLWEMSENQDDQWHNRTVYAHLLYDEQVSWKAMRTWRRTSDIAIDNIQVTKALFYCAFHNKNMCGLCQDESDSPCVGSNCVNTPTYEWMFSTKSWDPYLYLWPHQLPTNSFASVSLHHTALGNYIGPACIAFNYSMHDYEHYIQKDGDLEILYENLDLNASLVLWKRHGHQGWFWLTGAVTIVLTGREKLVWKGASGGRGSVAMRLAQVAILQGPCEGNTSSLAISDARNVQKQAGTAGFITYDLTRNIPDPNMTLITCSFNSSWNQSSGFSLEVLKLNIGSRDEFAVYGDNNDVLRQVKNCDRTNLEVVSLFDENVDVSFTMGLAGGNPLGRRFSLRYSAMHEVSVQCTRTITPRTNDVPRSSLCPTIPAAVHTTPITTTVTTGLANAVNSQPTSDMLYIGVGLGLGAGVIIVCLLVSLVCVLKRRKKELDKRTADENAYENPIYQVPRNNLE